MRPLRTALQLLAFALPCLAPAPAAVARSAFVLAHPYAMESIPAGTYDDRGRRLGDAALYWEKLPDGTLHMRAVTRIDGGARNTVNAWFEELDDGRGVRVLREDSLSYDVHGEPMTFVEVDHVNQRASCTPPPGSRDPHQVLTLDEDDHVANTTMSLLFQPLVRGEVDRVEFQAFLCRGGARLMNFVALAKRRRDEPDVVEVRFGPNLGRVASWLASIVVPKLRFWFEAEGGQYLAHRMPLYGGGPEVVVSREGVSAGFSQR
jgi:hypothetical protein